LLALSVPSDYITNDLSSNGYFASNHVILFSESTETNQISSGKNTVLTAVQLLHKRRFDGTKPHDDSRGKKKLLKPKPPDKHSIFCLPKVKIALFKKNSSILIKNLFPEIRDLNKYFDMN